MGTRHLIIVKDHRETKVAQYGQWDGDPSYTGVEVLKFLRGLNLPKFRSQLKKVSFLTRKQLDEYFNNISKGKPFVTFEEEEVAKKERPELFRDLGVGILDRISQLKPKEKLQLRDESTLLGEFDIEWAYEIDLDRKELYVYRGGTKPIARYPFPHGIPTDEQLIKLERR